jgi:nudix-type nucleoside diphosphatase (YffH/AdpP family)
MRIVDRKLIYQGWGRYFLLTVDLDDGAVVERQLDDHGAYSCVLPYDPDRRTALLARLGRAGPLYLGQEPHLIEAAAGMIDPGETPDACVRREAMEELGVRLEVLEPVGRVFTSPSSSSEEGHLYLAPYVRADRIAAGGGLAGEHEDIEVLELPLAELAQMAEQATVRDIKTLTLILALMRRRPDLFAET